MIVRTREAIVIGERQAGAYIDLKGCAFRYGKRVTLTTTAGNRSVVTLRRPVLAGKFTAFNSAEVRDELVDAVLVVQDLRSRTNRFTVTLDEQAEVRALVLKRNGSVAWIQNAVVAGEPTRQVVFCDIRCLKTAKPKPTVKDESRGISPRSLKLTGSRVQWTRDGATQSAAL